MPNSLLQMRRRHCNVEWSNAWKLLKIRATDASESGTFRPSGCHLLYIVIDPVNPGCGPASQLITLYGEKHLVAGRLVAPLQLPEQQLMLGLESHSRRTSASNTLPGGIETNCKACLSSGLWNRLGFWSNALHLRDKGPGSRFYWQQWKCCHWLQ